jgi:hypothetical protein
MIASIGAMALVPARLVAGLAGLDHPDPRPGVDASRVLTREDLAAYPDVADVYEGIRRMPHIADGIRCQCGCANMEGMRSLLTCFESNRMALHCEICQTEGRMVVRLHDAGRTLDQIRAAVDARFGHHTPIHHVH